MRTRRKVLPFIVAALILAVGAACGTNDASGGLREDNFIIAIKHNADATVYGMHIEYYIAGKPIGGGVTGYANGSPFKKGEYLTKDFRIVG